MTNKIGVTAANGTTTSKVVHLLAQKGVEVKAAVHSPQKAESLKQPHVEVVAFDYTGPDTFKTVLEGVDKIFMFTPFVPNAVELTKQFIDQAKAVGIQHIVKLSSMDADKEPMIEAKKQDYEVENYLKNSGITYTFLRCNHFMDNYIKRYAYTIKTQGKFYIPNGDAKVSFIATSDIAAVAVAVLTESGHENKTYTLTGKEALSNYQVAQIMSEVLGKPVEYVDIPEEEARKSLLRSGAPEGGIDLMMEVLTLIKEGPFARTTDDVEEILHREPISFKEFIEAHKDALI